MASAGVASCPVTGGLGCFIAAVSPGVVAWGVDQTVAGSRTALTGISTDTVGGQFIAQTFDIAPSIAEGVYGAAGGAVTAVASIATGTKLATQVAVGSAEAAGAQDAYLLEELAVSEGRLSSNAALEATEVSPAPVTVVDTAVAKSDNVHPDISDTTYSGSIVSAEQKNAVMEAKGWSPAWMPDTTVKWQAAEAEVGKRYEMVVTKETWDKIQRTNGGKLDTKIFGGWATPDKVLSQNHARDGLAITSKMKEDVSYVIEIEVIKPLGSNLGIAGSQGELRGGARQVEFNFQPMDDRASFFKIVGGRALPP